MGVPEFVMKVVGYHRSALSRQIGEAVRISRRGEVLNSKSEYSRCKITRLSLEKIMTENEQVQLDKASKLEEKDWTEVMLSKRDYQDRQDRQGLGEVRVSEVSKRKAEGKATRRTKKRKYNIIGENWGLGEIDVRRESANGGGGG